MLVSVPCTTLRSVRDPILDVISITNHKSFYPDEVLTGIYVLGHWNFDSILERLGYKVDSYPHILIEPSREEDDISIAPVVGVCDSPMQLFEKYKDIALNHPNRKFVVAMVPLNKADQPKEGGWRWRKWGEYIGEQKPVMEYLADEPVIETVYTFHIYEILDGEKR